MRLKTAAICFCLLLCVVSSFAGADLKAGFVSPPADCRPWVYWFWLNGNITKEGITADLEAMKRVGIGGVLIMEVDQGAPVGPVDFMSPKWRELFKHVISEAGRLGLEVNMNNDAGWNGSGGPWITPEQSMQKVVSTSVDLAGPQPFEGQLEQPETAHGYYRDIRVLAFPSVGSHRIHDIQARAAYQVQGVGPAREDQLAPEMVINPDRVIDISDKMGSSGKLVWAVPDGKWTVVRFGHTTTGVVNAPAPATGRGLECDKLSKEGARANFNGMMAKLASDVGPEGKALVATHVDSWENGSQNWTTNMREEFKTRRGYDMLPYLPVMSGHVVGSQEISDRFLWDLRKTISELVIENYAMEIKKLAHDNGMRFTIEAYGGPCDNLPYGGVADEPMGEFWDPHGAMETCKGMAAAGHVYGKRIIGAEAFTAGGHERWLQTPGGIKALGDLAFCNGINRFVFHRYAMQPWTEDRSPGMTMGPWGQHYERTQTWWEMTPAWHEYLSRCQYMLRQGQFVADICYLQPEAPPYGFGDHPRLGYDWDECPAEAVMQMTVKNGRLVLPSGMSYRVLVLPDTKEMTPALLRKIVELVKAGATVLGSRPEKSPSLTNYPACDAEVKKLADELWGSQNQSQAGVPVMRRYGKGWINYGITAEKLLSAMNVRPDFSSYSSLRFIHRSAPDAEIYFVSNPDPVPFTTSATFRVSGRVPELWWPDTGRIEPAVYQERGGATCVALQLEPSGSVFVCFGARVPHRSTAISSIRLNGKPALSAEPAKKVSIKIEKATYGVLGDPARTRDVKAKAQAIVENTGPTFKVAELARGDDPAYGTVKTAIIEYTIDGKRATVKGTDPETISLARTEGKTPVCELTSAGLVAWQPGRYAITTATGRKTQANIALLPKPLEITGPWDITFNSGSSKEAAKSVHSAELASWSDNTDPDIKYFSGTAAYRAVFDIPKDLIRSDRVFRLDLGDVRVMAQVRLNGKDLGTLWKPPFAIDVTDAIRPGTNYIQVKVANLWINRLIGDEQLPEDSERNPNGTLKAWPQWLLEGKPSPTGRQTFTSWRMWGKDDALQPSGLLGPVSITVGKKIAVP